MVENKNTTIENTRNVVKNTKCITENVKSAIKETERAEKAYFITTKELAEAGRDNIPDELISIVRRRHLHTIHRERRGLV